MSEGSPCIDAGTPDTTGLNLPATDLAGNPRIYNGRVDIGAYEYKPEAVGGEPDTNFVNKLYLFQNQPNPFKNSTEILFITSDYERVENYTLSIYNTKGQLVRRYAGRANNFSFKTKVNWDGKDSQGREVAPGTYFYKLEYNNNAVVRKMVKVK
ncbi:MAG: T9SS type A sorting domain-containing protein [Candidatus Cloacimonetes bacterium]|nr:T9SS type A sorting domain-containing protein [Candidatus Cloacimonadota bacterium]MBS3768383.1 T9SS type A sorting domain-containing protein [Candidatus Cloacimonadota bacterium]